MILDTDFVIELLAGDPDAERKAESLVSEGHVAKLPTMTVLEVLLGVESGASSAKRERIASLLDRFPTVPMDEEIAEVAAERIAEAGTSRFKKRKGDAVIAATAAIAGEPVLTRNREDFERLGVDVESY